MSRAKYFDEMMWMMMLHFYSATSLKKQFNYLCKQCLSPLKFKSRSWQGVLGRQVDGFLRVFRVP